MTWLRRNVTTDGVVTTSDTWLLHRLTGAYVTDATTASRTLLLDLERRTWSEEACAAFGLQRRRPPRASSVCAEEIGRTDAFGPSVAGERVERRPAGGAGRGALPRARRVEVHLRHGRLPAGQRRRGAVRLLRPAWPCRWPGSSASTRPIASTGRSTRPVRPSPGCAGGDSLRRAEDLDAVAGSVRDSGGVTVVPALSGLGAPWWRPDALASIEGIGPGTEPAHVVRATVEGLAAQVTLLARATAVDLGRPLTILRVDGGLTRSRRSCRRRPTCSRSPSRSPPRRTPRRPAWRRWPGSAPAREGRSTTWSHRIAARTRYEPAIAAAEAAERLERFERAVAAPWARPAIGIVTDDRTYDVAIIGAGVVGTAIARAAGPLPAPHRRARAVQRRRDGNLEGQHRHPAHRLRHPAGEPRIDAGPAGPRAARRLRGQRRASPSRSTGAVAGRLGRGAGGAGSTRW